MEKEDKIMLNKYETLNFTVERLGSEIIYLRKEEGKWAARRAPWSPRVRAEEALATSLPPPFGVRLRVE